MYFAAKCNKVGPMDRLMTRLVSRIPSDSRSAKPSLALGAVSPQALSSNMQTAATRIDAGRAIPTSALIVAVIIVVVCLGTLFGGFAGWVVGYFFEDAIMKTLQGFGVSPIFTMWELGATLGFIGGFFKPPQMNSP